VSAPSGLRISALNRKLLRDLWGMKTQALAIALVVAAGVSMYVMYLANFASLRETQQAYYDRQRFADVFASLKRAPQRVAGDIAAIPGVSTFETRTVATVTLDLPDLDEPATGRLVSIPAARRPRVNDLFLRQGRWIEPGRADEVLASEGFVSANGLEPGDRVPAIINGRRRHLTIVGVALSPEFIYSIRPGELVPDDRRFGILWMDQQALAAAFDMEGGFNDVVLKMAPGASVDEAISQLDGLLEPYGGLGAIPRALQLSHWTLQNELNQLQNFGFLLPLIFLMVAAFILNVALTRALALQRAQIAALKALGYGNVALGWHYMKWALIIGAAGVVLGIGAGAWLGAAIGALYNQFFRFPILSFSIPAGVILGAAALTLGAAALGAFSAVRRAVQVPPAEAMRPEPPARYRRSGFERLLGARLTAAGRMVLRNLSRRPARAAISVVGIGFAVAVLMVGFVFTDAIDRLMTTQFSVAERQDVTVNFVEPRSAAGRHALARLPGVIAVEPVRSVAARVRAGHRERYLAITGIDLDARLRRIVDAAGHEVRLAPAGVVVSKTLADVLDIAAGDDLIIEVLEADRPSRTVPVTGLVDDVMGLSVYMEMGALHQLMREGDVVSGALLLIDGAREDELSAALKRTPAVAGVGFKRLVLQSFRDTMAANMNLTIFINLLFAGVIAFGVVYNAARVSLSERSHELASLRVLGFTRAEISLILIGELTVLTLAALPAGAGIGYLMSAAIASTVQSEVYRFPLHVSRQAVALSWLGIIGAALVSALLVRRRLDRLDLIAVLKVRE
jgi:putative ABC transport system permease protein